MQNHNHHKFFELLLIYTVFHGVKFITYNISRPWFIMGFGSNSEVVSQSGQKLEMPKKIFELSTTNIYHCILIYHDKFNEYKNQDTSMFSIY